MTVDELSRIANRLRLDVVETVHAAGDGHPGPCMSIADIMSVLFFDEMKLDPQNPRWNERDRSGPKGLFPPGGAEGPALS